MTVSTITAEGGTIRLSTASDGSVSASSGDFAVAVVQQVEITGGLVSYPSVAALVTASEGTLAPGHYSAAVPTTHPEYPNTLTYWDGTNFVPRDLSPIEDLWNDIVFWVDQEGYFSSDLTRTDVVTTAASAVRLWSNRIGSLPVATNASGGTLSTTVLGRSMSVGTPLEIVDSTTTKLDVDGYFEVFSAVKLANNTDTNKGIVGKWNGTGWILVAQDFSAPSGVLFGIDGVYGRDSARLGTDPKVVSGRYASDGNVYVSVNGVDVGSASRGTGYTRDNTAPVRIGAYGSSGTDAMLGNVGAALKINRELTSGERAMVVAAIAKRSGITL